MYFEYLLIALSVIIVTALAAYAVLKKNGRADRKNMVNLVICTVLAMVCATLTPLLANLLVKELYFSVFISLMISFIASMTLAAGAILLSRRIVKKQESNILTEDSSTITLSQDGAATSNNDGLEAAARLNEMAAIQRIEDIKTAPAHDAAEIEESSSSYILKLIDEAMENKKNHNLSGAIASYESSIMLKPDSELFEWIIVDLCALYKMTNQKELVHIVLESSRMNLLNLEVKDRILRNL